MQLPNKLNDDQMVQFMDRATRDEQIAFVTTLFASAYADLIGASWVQKWVSKHASYISDYAGLVDKRSYPDAPEMAFQRRMAIWRKAHNRPHRRFLRWLERVGMPSRR